MSSSTEDVIQELFGNPMAILCFAVAVFALFVGLLIFDPFKGRKHRHHGHHSHSGLPRPTLRQRLWKPFVQIRAVWVVLTDLARRRARHRARAERLAEQMRRYK